MNKTSYIHGIRTRVPPHRLSREAARDFMVRRLGPDPAQTVFLDRIYQGSAIDYRYSLLPDYAFPEALPGQILEKVGSDPGSKGPGTAQRNDLYEAAARSLTQAAAADLLGIPPEAVSDLPKAPEGAFPGDGSRCLPGPSAGSPAPAMGPGRITHLVTFSCTGFTAPGFEMALQKDLGLPDSVQRFHLGFMGCYATFPALRLAHALCSQTPGAKVLVVGVELCTLHFQTSLEGDNMVAGALFADGAYALLVSSDPEDSRNSQPLYSLEGFTSRLVPGSQQRMAWDIGDHGFEMKLSSYVPKIIEGQLPNLESDLLGPWGLTREEIRYWAIHPGGRAILDRVRERLSLPQGTLDPSYRILRDYGNMSAATFGFLLADLASQPGEGARVLGAAFGPGLTVEGGLFTLRPRVEPTMEEGPPAPGVLRGAPETLTIWQKRFGVLSPNLPLWPDISGRWTLEELMDHPGVEPEALEKTIGSFSRINRHFSAYRQLLRREVLDKMTDPRRVYELVDVGAGGGDIALWLSREARKRGLKLQIHCVDQDPRTRDWAAGHTKEDPQITCTVGGLEVLRRPEGWDFVFCNHVLHHLGRPELLEFCRGAARARVNAVLSDLRRSRWGYWGYGLASWFLYRGTLAPYDGRVSVLRGFLEKELEALVREACPGKELRVRKTFPFRLLISSSR